MSFKNTNRSSISRKRKRCGILRATTYRKRPRVVVADVVTTSTECCFCGEGENIEYGTFFQSEESNLAAHQFCLFFSAGLPQNGEDTKGFDGFLFSDILKEVQRSINITCKICHKKGASSGCSVTSCHSVYHFKCGLKSGVQFVFKDAFDSYCKRHCSKQDLRRIKTMKPSAKCPICLDEIKSIDHNKILRAPCCKDMFVHRSCVKMQAYVSGYFFRCPTCNNSKDFFEEMSTHGIFIPQRDAGWEENGAFDELLEKYSRCDLLHCKCMKGRNYCTKAGKWHLLVCYLCGQSAVHVQCLARHYIPGIGYVCKDCNHVVGLRKTDPSCCQSAYMSRLKEHKKRLNELTTRNDPVLLASSVFAAQIWKNKFEIRDCKVVVDNILAKKITSEETHKKKWLGTKADKKSSTTLQSSSLSNTISSVDQDKIICNLSSENNELSFDNFILSTENMFDKSGSQIDVQPLSNSHVAENITVRKSLVVYNNHEIYNEENGKKKISYYSRTRLFDIKKKKASNISCIEENYFNNIRSKFIEFCDQNVLSVEGMMNDISTTVSYMVKIHGETPHYNKEEVCLMYS